MININNNNKKGTHIHNIAYIREISFSRNILPIKYHFIYDAAALVRTIFKFPRYS